MHIVIEDQPDPFAIPLYVFIPVWRSAAQRSAAKSELIVFDKPDLTTALPARLCKIK